MCYGVMRVMKMIRWGLEIESMKVWQYWAGKMGGMGAHGKPHTPPPLYNWVRVFCRFGDFCAFSIKSELCTLRSISLPSIQFHLATMGDQEVTLEENNSSVEHFAENDQDLVQKKK